MCSRGSIDTKLCEEYPTVPGELGSPPMNSTRVIVAVLVYLSGFSALVCQIAWMRSLRLVFGCSTAATAAVLVIFIGGLGACSLLFRRRVDRHASPLRLFANLEIGIAGLAAASPLLIYLAREIYVAMGGSLSLGAVGGTAVRLLLSVVVLGGPALLMGGTLPAVSRAVQTDADASRRLTAMVYGANTAGAFTGALLATFVMLEAFGVRTTIFIAAMVSGLVSVCARLLAPRARALQDKGEPRAGDSDAPSTPASERPAQRRFVLVAAALVGFAFLLMELVWYRMLAPILGGSSYTFGLILAVALLGIGLGALLYRRRAPDRPVTLRSLAITCVLEALFIALPLALGDRVALFALFLSDFRNMGFEWLVMSWSVIAAVVVLPGAVVAGYQFPVLVALLGSGRREVGHQVCQVYAWNTGGAILGSLAGGFVLVPLLTAPHAWRFAAGVLLVVGFASLVSHLLYLARRDLYLPLALSAVSVILLCAHGPTAFWRHSPIGAGLVAVRSPTDPNALRDFIHKRQRSVAWERDGLESSVALQQSRGYAFSINGKIDGNARDDVPTTVMLGLLGAVFHPEPRSGLVIGLGSGATAGWLAAVPSIERVDVLELEPAILDVARVCGPINENALDNPRVNIVIGDAREVLLTTSERYDLIMSVLGGQSQPEALSA